MKYDVSRGAPAVKRQDVTAVRFPLNGRQFIAETDLAAELGGHARCQLVVAAPNVIFLVRFAEHIQLTLPGVAEQVKKVE